MRLFRRGLLLGCLAGATMAIAGGAPALAETTLTLSSYSPTTAWSATRGLAGWIKDVEAESKGRVKVRLLETALGKPESHFDLARNGIADVTFGVLGYTPGRFEIGAVGGMPGAAATGKSISVALWRLYESEPAFQKEFEGVTVLSLTATSPQQIFTSKGPVKTIEDYKGLKVRVPGGLVAEAVAALGLTGVNQPSGKAYELLSTGILDGIAFPKETVPQFKLLDLVRHATMLPGGVGSAPLFLVMNKARFDSLPKEDQDAIMRASGEKFAAFYGSIWDERDASAVETMRNAGIQIIEADAALAEAAAARFAEVEKRWIERVKTVRNVDGAKILEKFRTEAKKVEAGT